MSPGCLLDRFVLRGGQLRSQKWIIGDGHCGMTIDAELSCLPQLSFIIEARNQKFARSGAVQCQLFAMETIGAGSSLTRIWF